MINRQTSGRYGAVPRLVRVCGLVPAALAIAAVWLLPGTRHTGAIAGAGAQQQPAPIVTITLSAPEALTVGGRTALVRADVTGPDGSPVADGAAVTLTVSAGEITPAHATTVAGVVTATLASDRRSGEAEITASAAGALTQTRSIAYLADRPAVIHLAPTPSTVAGRSVPVPATVRDAFGNPAGEGEPVTWTSSLGTILPTVSVVHGGETHATLQSVEAGTAAVTAALDGVRGAASVRFVPGPAAAIELVPAQLRIPVEGETAVDVAGVDAYGNLVAEPLTVLVSGSGGTVQPSSVVLQGGRASARYRARDLPGEFEIAASSSAVVGSAFVSVRPADLGIEAIVEGPRGKVPEGQVHPGDRITYEVTVRNSDLTTARNIVLGAVLPDAFIDQEVRASGGVSPRSRGPSGLIDAPPEGHHTRFWTIPDLALGASVTLDISGRIDPSRRWNGLDNVYFRSAATSTTVEASLGDLTRGRLVPVQAADMYVVADLDFEASILRPGGLAVLDIAFGNQFRTTEVDSVRVTSTLPAGLIYDHWQMGLGAEGITQVGQFGSASHELVWRVEPEHAAGGSLRLWLEIDPDAAPDAVLNHDVAIASDVYEVEPGNNTHSRGIVLRGVNLVVEVESASEAAPGEEVTYRLELTNVSQRDSATGVRFLARPPADANNIRWTAGGLADPGGGVAWEVGSLSAGGHVEYEVTLDVSESAAVGGVVAFSASASGAETDSYPADNEAVAETRVVAGPPALADLLDPPALEACSSESRPVQARLFDRFGNPVRDGTAVEWTVSSGTVVDAGPTAGGVASAGLVAGRTAGIAQLAVAAGDASAKADVSVAPGRISALAVTVQPRIVPAGGWATVAVNAMDRCSQPVGDGQFVRLTTERGGWNGQRQLTLETAAGRVEAELTVGSAVGPLRIEARHQDVVGETIVSVLPPEEVPTPTPVSGTRLLMPIVLGRQVR